MKGTLGKIALHMLLWTGIWFYFFYFFNYNSSDRGYVIWFSSLLLPLTMAITYFAVYFLIPIYLLPKKYGRFALFSFYTLLAYSYFIVLVIYGCLIFYKKMDASSLPPMVKNFFFVLILVYLVVVLVGFVYILNQGFRTEKRNRELQHKMLTAQLQFKEQELSLLKKQIHPHFLFNTLNTIYGMAMKRSENTPGVILKLSNLLDYILYQVDKPMVSLKEEVLHIREYIELEKIRFRDTLIVEFTSDPIPDDVQVAPMILIPLVENAFKHGRAAGGILNIRINIGINGGLDFSISNSTGTDEGEKDGHGIGIENLKKRLELNYRDNYQFEKEVTEGLYLSRLVIRDLKIEEHG